MLGRLRALVKEADPELVEAVKWRGVPVWSHDRIICTGETYKSVVKMTFAKGATLKEPARLFNFQSCREHKVRDRLPRECQGERAGTQDSRPSRRDAEQIQSPKLDRLGRMKTDEPHAGAVAG